MDKSTLRYSSNALGCETLSYATTVISKPPALGRELACRADLDMIQQQQQQQRHESVPHACCTAAFERFIHTVP